MTASWRRKVSVIISLIVIVLVIVSCRALPTQAGSTFTAEEIDSMIRRASPSQGSGSEPELPRVYLNTTYTPPTGKTIAVAAGGDFQAALNQAAPGDIITLQAGATFTGNFTLPTKSGNNWIVIRTSAPDSSLPPAGTRITPTFASALPKILSPNKEPALTATEGAHHYRLIGLEFGLAAGVTENFSLIALGNNETSMAQLPHDLILDRLYIHGAPSLTLRRGILLNSASTAVIDSHISDCHEVGADSQAIGGYNGAGPFKIVNNYLEGAGENFILGGGDPTIPNLVPSDVEFRRNHCFKPTSWRIGDPSYAGTPWGVKNSFELKNAQRVLVDGNTFENNWTMAQNGYSILFTVRNQDGGSPWSVVQDVTFINNIIKNVGGAITMHGTDNLQPSMRSRRFRISNNLLDNVNGVVWAGTGIAFQVYSGVEDIIIEHNTVFNTFSMLVSSEDPTLRLVFRNNLMPHNEFGVKGDGKGTGTDSITTYFPSAVFVKNVIVGGPKDSYPGDNFFPASFDDVRFINRGQQNYRLALGSPFKNAGTDGLDIGCDFNALFAAVNGTTNLASVSAASYSPVSVSPDSIAAVFGTGFSTSTLASSSVPLPTNLLGTSVRVTDTTGTERLSPLFLVSPTQINYLIPSATTIGTARVTVTNGSSAVGTGIASISSIAPGLFTVDSTGRGLPTANVLRVKSDNQLVYETVARFDSSQNRFVAVPIDLGVVSDQVFLILYGTGIRNNKQLSAVRAEIGGVSAPVIFAGMQDSLIGVDQINISIPRSLAGRGNVDLTLKVGEKTANTISLNIK